MIYMICMICKKKKGSTELCAALDHMFMFHVLQQKKSDAAIPTCHGMTSHEERLRWLRRPRLKTWWVTWP